MFRRWQRDNRDLGEEDDDGGGGGGFPVYLEAEKRDIRRRHSGRAAAERLAELEADPSRLKEMWDYERERRAWQRFYCREPGYPGVGFSDYAAAARRRLAQHGFTRRFELNRDPKRQGRLDTWIEYLSFEYWWLDQFMNAIKCRKARGDRVSRELKDTGVLQPIETRAPARNRDRAAREEFRRSMARPQSLVHQLSLLINELRDATRDAAHHLALLPWILAQIPSVEADMRRGGNGSPETDRAAQGPVSLPPRT